MATRNLSIMWLSRYWVKFKVLNYQIKKSSKNSLERWVLYKQYEARAMMPLPTLEFHLFQLGGIDYTGPLLTKSL